MTLTRLEVIIVSLVVFLMYIYFGEAAQATGFAKNKDHPGKCYFNDQLILNDGDEAVVNCTVYKCLDGKTGYSTLQSCGAISQDLPKNCEWSGEKYSTAPYPKCCFREIRCKDANDEPKEMT